MGYIISVEDEESIRNNIVEILEVESYQVTAFAEPAEFLDFLKSNSTEDIELIMADIMMPGMSGIDMIRAASEIKSLTGIPVIFLTALDDDVMINTAYETAAVTLTVDYIVKPFQVGWLLAKIRTLISLKNKNDLLTKANENILATNLEIQDILSKTDLKNEYLTDRLKKIIAQKDLEVEKKINIVKELIPKIAVNDLTSLKFVAEIVEKNQQIIDSIIREPTEEDEFFKILARTAEPLRTAIWDIEQTIKLFISMGIIEFSSIEEIDFEKTSFYEILLKNYKNGGFSAEQFQRFIENAKFKVDNSDIILF